VEAIALRLIGSYRDSITLQFFDRACSQSKLEFTTRITAAFIDSMSFGLTRNPVSPSSSHSSAQEVQVWIGIATIAIASSIEVEMTSDSEWPK
jgi:hypothetical protein